MSHTLIIMLVALFFSALFSGLEIAFVSADRLRFEMDVERHTFSSRLLERFFRNSWEYYYIGGLTSSSQPAFYAQRLFASNSFFVISCLPSSSNKSFIPLQTPIYTSTSPGLIEIVCQINHQLVTDTTSHSFTSTSVTPNTTCNH